MDSTFLDQLNTLLSKAPETAFVAIKGQTNVTLAEVLRKIATFPLGPLPRCGEFQVDEGFFRKVMCAFATYDYLGAPSNWGRTKRQEDPFNHIKVIAEWAKWSFEDDHETYLADLAELEAEVCYEDEEIAKEIAQDREELVAEGPFAKLKRIVVEFEAFETPDCYEYLENYFC